MKVYFRIAECEFFIQTICKTLKQKTMAQEDDLRALGKIMDFLRAVSIILAIMNVYWYCYEAMHIWGVTIGVVDRILINFNRTGGVFLCNKSSFPMKKDGKSMNPTILFDCVLRLYNIST